MIYGAAGLLGLGLEYFWRAPLFASTGRPVAIASGALLLLAFLVLVIWAERVMHRAGTNVLPTRPSIVVVTHGPFALTRNPIYLGVTLGYIGGCLLLNTAWPLLTLPVALAVIEFGVIRREECYLERKFGDAYRAYRRRVRRWL